MNRISSAPKDFDVEVFDDVSSRDSAGAEEYGPFHYDGENSEKPLQYFEADKSEKNHKAMIVKLNILSNHGHPNFTCVYRFRVHGSYAGPGS